METGVVDRFFPGWEQRAVRSEAQGFHGVFQFELSGDAGGVFHVVVDDGRIAVADGPHSAPSCTIKMSVADYDKLREGKLNGQVAFMTGKMKVSGNVMQTMKFAKIFPTKAN